MKGEEMDWRRLVHFALLAARGNSHYLRRRVALAALREFLELTGCRRADQAALQHKVSRVV
jgi:hypothetical protein